MSDRATTLVDRLGSGDLTRREALATVASGGLALGAGKAVDNVLVGYGVLTGTNLVDQDLAPLVRERFGPSRYETSIRGHPVGYRDGTLELSTGDGVERVPVGADAVDRRAEVVDRAADLDGRYGLSGRFADLARDLLAVAAGDYRFAFGRTDEFFGRIEAAGAVREETVGALRGSRFDRPDPRTVRGFSDADPADVAALVPGLASGFREHSHYDFARYAAGSVEDNVLLGAGDLREPFRSPTSFEAILDGRNSGLFCYDFTYRSVEAFHAVPPREQTVPVLGAVVTDARHKHVYTGLASAVRVDGELVIPMTFLDYMHATQYDDLGLRGVLGEGIEAYGRRHRTDGVYWNRYAIW